VTDSLPQDVLLPNDTGAQVRHGVLVAGVRLLVPVGTRSELVPMASGCRIPGSPDWFSGFINHRGDVIPVFNMGVLLNGKNADLVPPKWVLLLDSTPDTVGIMTDDYPASLTDYQPCDLPTDIASALEGFVNQAYLANDHVWLELDHKALFTSLIPQFNA
jgi:twitching motility protein PilI